MATIKIRNIQKVVLAGRQVKLFDVYKETDEALVYVGQYSAPARTANKNLAAFIN